MSILNRDYMRSPSRHPMLPAGWGAIEVIMAINVAVFLGIRLFDPMIEFSTPYLALSLENLKNFRIHTLVTYAFTHYNIWHIVLNMFMFWQFARIMEREWGTKTAVWFYLYAGVFSGAFHFALSGVENLFFPSGGSLIGASGAVAGFIFAFALTHSGHRLMLFGIIPMTAMTLGLLFVGFDMFGLVKHWATAGATDGGPAVAHGAHLAGALYGYLFVRQLRGQLPFPVMWIPSSSGKRRRRRSNRSNESTYDYAEPAPRVPTKDEKRMDELLAKVKEGGLDALSPEEREFMMDMSRRYRRN